jgi:hypothetical protein
METKIWAVVRSYQQVRSLFFNTDHVFTWRQKGKLLIVWIAGMRTTVRWRRPPACLVSRPVRGRWSLELPPTLMAKQNERCRPYT